MNWFVQLCLSLEYIHGRRMLHRDLKSQNVFLTANGTVKLGDFGISKVLENTNDVAMTV
jgi:NIMA (never in mitosis gene a)-related kinase